jgi:hypothetical protein
LKQAYQLGPDLTTANLDQCSGAERFLWTKPLSDGSFILSRRIRTDRRRGAAAAHSVSTLWAPSPCVGVNSYPRSVVAVAVQQDVPGQRRSEERRPPPGDGRPRATWEDEMPRFFFNLRDDVSIEDCEGKELADVEMARQLAVQHARGMMSEDIKDGRLMLKDEIEVVDEAGRQVISLSFRDAIDIQE